VWGAILRRYQKYTPKIDQQCRVEDCLASDMELGVGPVRYMSISVQYYFGTYHYGTSDFGTWPLRYCRLVAITLTVSWDLTVITDEWRQPGAHWSGNPVISKETSIVCRCSWWTLWTLSLNAERAADIHHWNVWTVDERVVQSCAKYASFSSLLLNVCDCMFTWKSEL